MEKNRRGFCKVNSFAMETNKILNADYLDIIFDNRNKNYGSYQLRKHYNGRALRALGITSLLLLLGAGTPFIIGKLNAGEPAALAGKTERTVVMDRILMPPPEQPKEALKPPKAETAAPPAAAKTVRNNVPEIVSNDKPVVKPPEIKDLDNAVSGPVDNPGENGTETALTKDPRKGSFGDGSAVEGAESGGGGPAVKEPVTFAEQMPEYPGGIKALMAYLKSNLRYPPAAAESGIEGRVVVTFIVGMDGSIEGARVVRGIGGGCDREALRVVNAMPKWKPGRQNGHKVKVYFTLPISFYLEK